jgi:hypothetical protein
MTQAAYLVRTRLGNIGKVYRHEPEVKGKIILRLQDKDGKPITDRNGQQKKMLVRRLDVDAIIGFIN